jgi:glycosyltransferase involved in cell wall biosynthesis
MTLRIFVPSAASLLTDRRGNGEGLIAWHLLSGIAARGHELVVCAREADLAADPPFELIVTGRASRFESIEPLAYAQAARQRLRTFGRFDLAHWLFPTGARDALFVPPADLPLVLGPHSAPWPREARTRRRPRAGDAIAAVARPAFTWYRKRTLDAAAAVLVTTPAALEALPAQARSKARIIPRGIDLDAYKQSPPAERRQVLFVGKLERAKGVVELVEAFARAGVKGARLVLAGEGPERGRVERRARELGLDGNHELLGSVPHQRVAGLLSESSLLCLPSYGEPFGMAVLEAMAAGRAVVATDAGGPRLLVDRTLGGRLVAPGDTEGLAAALRELLNDPDGLAAMGAFNRVRAEQEFALDSVIDAIEDVYASVVGGSR